LGPFFEHHLRDSAPNSSGGAGNEANFVVHMF
jgi:hypothetical protein